MDDPSSRLLGAGNDTPSKDCSAQWEAALKQFRARCHSDNPPTIQSIRHTLGVFPPTEQDDMLVDLVTVHLRQSWEGGWGKLLEEYLAEFGRDFAEFASTETVPPELVETEFIARHAFVGFSDHPGLDEYRQRFADRADVMAQLCSRCLDGERYVRIRRQGQGGLGRVWLAYDCHLRRQVAIKEPNPAVADDQRILARLAEEACLTAGLDHPAIVAVHELRDFDEELPFYVMRLVQGRTLREFIHDYHDPNTTHDLASRRLLFNQLLQAFTTVCEAVAYAHARGILHRDLKPHNIVLGEFGETVVLDWGLARRLAARAVTPTAVTSPGNGKVADQAPSDMVLDTHSLQLAASTPCSSPLGTAPYVAPEQARGITDERSDIFGLGAILYQILTGSPPYEAKADDNTEALWERVREARYRRPRDLNPGMPRALEAVCLKALAALPKDRYGTAAEMARDVQHWLADEPVTAYREPWTGKLGRRVRRHPAVVGLTAALVLMFFVAFAAVKALEAASEKHERANVLAEVRNERIEELHIQAERKSVEAMTRQMEFEYRSPKRFIDWRAKHWKLGRDAASIHKSDELKHELASGCIGLDAIGVKHFDAEAGAVAFNQSGKRMLLGDTPGSPDKRGQPARLWDSQSGELLTSTRAGLGPVAFRVDGTAVQLVSDASSLLLWDMVKQQAIQTLSFLVNEQPGRVVALTMAPDASHVVASVLSKGRRMLVVWEAETGKVLHRFEDKGRIVAFSPDKSLLATGDEDGRLTLWGLLHGQRIATLPPRRMAIQSLAFSTDAGLLQPKDAGNQAMGRLAVGDGGGAIFTYDLATLTRSVSFVGSHFHVYAVAFSSDGTILASGGRGHINLWDSATGRLLLQIPHEYTTALAFSPDGTQLAASSLTVFGPGQASIWELQNGLGIQTLLGLSNPVAKVAFSPNGRYIAALSHDWQVAIWDSVSGQLRRLLEAPQGTWVDNADLRFSPDGTRLAFAGGKEAKLWEVTSGRELGTWKLPEGLVNALAFHPSDKLLLFRVETKEGKLGPFYMAPPDQHPRVCRIHELGSQPTKPLEIFTFNWHVEYSLAAPDGSYFVASGLSGLGGKDEMVGVFDGLTGRTIWSLPAKRPGQSKVLALDPTGKILALLPSKDGEATLVEMPSGKLLSSLEHFPESLGPGARYWTQRAGAPPFGLSLFRHEDKSPLVTLGIDVRVSSFPQAFNVAGTHLAWGNEDGTVNICDLMTLRRRLATVGFDW
jgi:serine/threonine protein kinase/WD40 repeat protein